MSQVNESQVILEFERRKKRLLHNFGAAMLLVLLSLVLREIVDSLPHLFGLGGRVWYSLAAAQFVCGVMFALRGFLQFRCPVCDEIPRGHDKYYLGVTIHPSRCPKCGARLSED